MVEVFAGTESITGTAHSLTTDTDGPDVETSDGEFRIHVDVSAIADGTIIELQVLEKAQSGDTQRVIWSKTFNGVQASPGWQSPRTFSLMHGWDATLKKLAGADTTCTWSIREVTNAAGVIVTSLGSAVITTSSIADGAITAAKIGADAITNAKIADDAIAVENIKDNAITAAKIATNAIDSDSIDATAVTELQAGLATATNLATVAGYIDTEVADIQTRVIALQAAVARVLGLAHENAMLDNHTYSAGKLTGARLRVFADATALGAAVAGHADGTDSETQRYTIAVTYSGNDVATYKITRAL